MLELWGGVECTVNRIGDRYLDQILRSGHHTRLSDLERFAALGISAIRYPVLWERTWPDRDAGPDWRWSDERLTRLAELGVRPIVGLLHHGSGPRHTRLDDPDFPVKFAAYATAVAERYPWVETWTPINEPVTTARFSGMYGFWYPHARTPQAFVRMVMNQCRAAALATFAIRAVNPRAMILHTEDAGTIYSTPPLAYQAEFENLRRDLATDLLFGRVTHDHPLYGYLHAHGAQERDLEWFAEHPAPPDIIGANYYVTSDRMLDHRIAQHPPETHGGNGRQHYADVAAVTAQVPWMPAFAGVLERCWLTYHRPVVLSEVHIACSREEQLRWLDEAWAGARQAEALGIPVRAVTLWSLLGAYDWDQLVTTDAGRYESGIFDIRSPAPRSTALFGAARALTKNEPFHQHLLQPGWWRRVAPSPPTTAHPRTGRRLLILGAGGTLGTVLSRHCTSRALEHVALDHQQLDITDAATVREALSAYKPWAVINASGFVRVDDAESFPGTCHLINGEAAIMLAQNCAQMGSQLVSFSTDLVFDGLKRAPYVESDATSPLNAYGRSKEAAERGVLAACPHALMVRTSAFFTSWDESNFAVRTLGALSAGRPIRASGNVVSPTWVPALADAVLDLMIDQEDGIWHLANVGSLSWADLARYLVAGAGGNPDVVEEVEDRELGHVAARPPYSALASERGTLLPTVEQSLDRFLWERNAMDEQASASTRRQNEGWPPGAIR